MGKTSVGVLVSVVSSVGTAVSTFVSKLRDASNFFMSIILFSIFAKR